MTTEECLRVLNLSPGSTPEQVRRAYLDLAQVWHPDRFEADPRLRKIAEDHLREINEAYTRLKGGRPTSGPRRDPPRTAPVMRHARFSFAKLSALLLTVPAPVLRAACVMAACLAPVVVGAKIASMFRVPVLDPDAVASRVRAIRPPVLSPMSILDYLSDSHVAADTLNDWAHGDIVNLWSRAPKAPAAAVPQAPATPRSRPNTEPPAQETKPLANGTEFLAFDRQGAGELRVQNATALEALVFLLRNGQTTVRVMYVGPGLSAVMKFIPVGVYTVQPLLGNGVDVTRLRFARNSRTLERSKLQFLEIMSADSSWGAHPEITLKMP